MELHVDGLRVVRGWRMVLNGLSFSLCAGEALLLRGPNGAGKSTLLRTLAGFILPDAGDARLGPASLGTDRAEFVGNVTYTGHLDALKPSMTATETLAFHADIYGISRARIADALAAMGLEKLADQPVRILSAGQKRRLGLARLALSDRPVWLLDEPTVSLDAESAERVAALARRHCEMGGMVIAATHIDLAIPGAAVLNPGDFGPDEAAAGRVQVDDVLSGESW